MNRFHLLTSFSGHKYDFTTGITTTLLLTFLLLCYSGYKYVAIVACAIAYIVAGVFVCERECVCECACVRTLSYIVDGVSWHALGHALGGWVGGWVLVCVHVFVCVCVCVCKCAPWRRLWRLDLQ